jgi:hypothetical protein
MRRLVLLLPIVLCTPACGPSSAPPSSSTAAPDRTFDTLLGLMRQRLGVMHDVARYKWTKKAPIEDPEREAALLTRSEASPYDSLAALRPYPDTFLARRGVGRTITPAGEGRLFCRLVSGRRSIPSDARPPRSLSRI